MGTTFVTSMLSANNTIAARRNSNLHFVLALAASKPYKRENHERQVIVAIIDEGSPIGEVAGQFEARKRGWTIRPTNPGLLLEEDR